jgi:cytoskeletal protein CcmA (bactofilin family)
MPEAARPGRAAAPPPVVARDAEFSGLVLLPRPARIDGRVDGAVIASDLVWIGETARVRARIEAEEVVVAGEVDGPVTARRRAELLPTARVRGDLETARLTLAEGSRLEGMCRAGGESDAASS